jgi:cell wall-associated NlpC family hydrolase
MGRLVRGTMILPFFVLMAAGCTPKYDYTIHKPRVVYQQPSRQALRTSLGEILGKKYVWAEEGPEAFDCSGLTYYAFGRMNLEIPRVSSDQAKGGVAVPRDALQYGDLVFFDTGKNFTGTVTHVAEVSRFPQATSPITAVIRGFRVPWPGSPQSTPKPPSASSWASARRTSAKAYSVRRAAA